MPDGATPYELTFEQRPDHLYAHLTAEATSVPLALEYWKTIIDKCRELGARRLLVNQEIPGGLNTPETFQVADEVTKMGIHDIKIAFVDPHPQNYERHEFGALVAGNRGAWAKVFTTLPEAENWLLQGPDR